MNDSNPSKVIDRKFIFEAINPVNGKRYTQNNAIILCAHDESVPAALMAYRDHCRAGSNAEHIESLNLLIDRVFDFQKEHGSKTPDTKGDELRRCIEGDLSFTPALEIQEAAQESEESDLYSYEAQREAGNTIEEGQEVSVSFPGHAGRVATLIHRPIGQGDCWVFVGSNGKPFYISESSPMMMEKV